MADVIAYKKTSITGGTINSLDGIDGAALKVDDFGFVFAADEAQYDYEVRESGATPDGLNIVIPVMNPGDMRWHIKLRTADSLANVALTHADVLLTNADVVLTHADVVLTHADEANTHNDAIATVADRVQTGLDRVATGQDKIATAADRVQTGLDRIATAADVVTATAQAAALIGTSTTSLLIEIASKTFTTQASKKFAAGMFVLAVSDADPTNYMHGQVTSYSSTTLVVNITNIGGSGTLADWTISVSGSRGAKGDVGTGITEESVGWTGTGGTTPKTLTVDTDVTVSALAPKASPSFTGTFNWAAASELTIAIGEITATQAIHTVDTESDDASDDLVTINGEADGRLLAIRASHTDRTVVIKSTGNINTGGSDITLDDTLKYVLFVYDSALSKWVVVGGSGGASTTFASAAEELAGVEVAKASSPSVSREMLINLKPVVNAAVNKLDVFTKSGGAAPDATNPIKVMIPDGNGYTQRTRTGSVASGTGQIIFADATDYWSRGSTSVTVGTATTQFDITNPAGTTARYTYDTTGVDPGLSATWPRIGEVIVFAAQNFNAANNGAFIVTGSGTNYVEVTNAGVVAETDKTVGTGSIVILRPTPVYLYAIFSTADDGIVLAAGGFSGFDKVSTTTVGGDDDYLLLEDGSSYTRVNTDRCVVIAKGWKTYHTTDSPDHRLHTALEFAPQVIWNPKSDYSGFYKLASDNVSAGDIALYSAISHVVKQSGLYFIFGKALGFLVTNPGYGQIDIKTGNSVFASATSNCLSDYCGYPTYNGTAGSLNIPAIAKVPLNAGDTIHLGAASLSNGGSGNRAILAAGTNLFFMRMD